MGISKRVSTLAMVIYIRCRLLQKPDRQFAQMFMDSKEWCWNTGLFLSNTNYLRQCLYGFLPSVIRDEESGEKITTIEEEEAFIRENFPRYPNISLDHGILEKSDNVYVMKCDFGWADLGTWHGVYESLSKREEIMSS